MKINTFKGLLLSLLLGLTFTAAASDWGGDKRLILNLVGTGLMYESTVPDIDGDLMDDPAICFDVDIGVINGKNRELLGAGTDCLSNIVVKDGGLALVGTTFFYLPQGTLITRGKTTVQPVLQPTTTTTGQIITHETAAAAEGNSIIGGTGWFSGVTGSVRLGGLVDMTDFGGNVGDPIFFDCLFIVDLDFLKRPGHRRHGRYHRHEHYHRPGWRNAQ